MIGYLIDAIREHDWVMAVGLAISIGITVALLIPLIRRSLQNLQRIPEQLRSVAATLHGKYTGYGLFGRRPSVRGTFQDMPVRIDFPENWRNVVTRSRSDIPRIWFRIRFRLPRKEWLWLDGQNAASDLCAAGVSPEAVWRKTLRKRLARLFGDPHSELLVRGRTAIYRTPLVWDHETVTTVFVLDMVESAHAVLAAVLDLGRPETGRTGEKVLAWLPDGIRWFVSIARRLGRSGESGSLRP